MSSAKMRINRIHGQMVVTGMTISRKAPSASAARGNHLLSYTVEFNEPLGLDDARIAAALGGLEVDLAVLNNAVSGGVISRERFEDEKRIVRRNYNMTMHQLVGLEPEGPV